MHRTEAACNARRARNGLLSYLPRTAAANLGGRRTKHQSTILDVYIRERNTHPATRNAVAHRSLDVPVVWIKCIE
jgi:hypothetical protein